MTRSPRRRAISMRVATLAALLALGAAPAQAHTVIPGETLSGIAAANGVSTEALAAANGLGPTSFVIAGTTLTIPAPGSTAPVATATTPASSAPAAGGHYVTPGETLTGIAAANGITPAALAAANGLTPTSFVIAGTRLRIPAAGSTTPAPAGLTAAGSAGGHLVVVGETLTGIAAANGITPAALAAANGLTPTSFVIAGTRLRVPAAASATSAPAGSTAQPGSTAQTGGGSIGGHLVTVGETLTGIAAANGITSAALAAANGLTPTSFVIAGTRLRIPAATGSAASSSGAPEAMGGYIVRPGDTLAALAARSRLPVAQVAAMNGLKPDAMLLIGQPLKLPTGSPVLATAPAQSAPVSAALAPQASPNPTPGRVTAGEVASIAAGNGVPGSLAAAIAWQESGFNNAMVSAANARGVMQVMPGTWAWIQRYLASRPLNPNSPLDNVHAGTLYLGQLLRQTGGDPALAAAGYYQGLSSVRRVGMFPETRRYVDNVLALRSRFGG